MLGVTNDDPKVHEEIEEKQNVSSNIAPRWKYVPYVPIASTDWLWQ